MTSLLFSGSDLEAIRSVAKLENDTLLVSKTPDGATMLRMRLEEVQSERDLHF